MSDCYEEAQSLNYVYVDISLSSLFHVTSIVCPFYV